MSDCSDETLVRRFQASADRQAFDELVHRHLPRVRAMIVPMVLNDADADDLAQIVFMQAARGLPKFRRQASFGTWLHRITMNATLSFLRRRAASPVTVAVELPDRADSAPDPSAAAMGREGARRVEAALASLRPPLRAALTLVVIEGMPVLDAARALGCLPATLYWRIHQARKQLREILQAE